MPMPPMLKVPFLSAYITHNPSLIKSITTSLVLGASLILASCGGGGSSGGGNNVSGVAATGAPIVGGTVTLTCLNSFTTTATTSANGQWSASVPNTNLPCAVKVEGGTVNGITSTEVYFSSTDSGSGRQTVNITPLTSLTLAQALGTVPDNAWFDTLDDASRQTLADGLAAASAALNTALASYALPANFNPFSSSLTAAITGQQGNDYDRLLDQLKAALKASTDPSFSHLLATFAAGTPLPTPSYTPGAATQSAFFTALAGDYSLLVSSVGDASASLFPMNRAIVVSLKTNGDVSIKAVGRTITYKAADYSSHPDFSGSEINENIVRYWSGTNIDLFISYNPATGAMRVSPTGFLANSEGAVKLDGRIFAPAPASTCAGGNGADDRVDFANGPNDYCSFTKNTSAHTSNLYQFVSASGTHGTTSFEFVMKDDGITVNSINVETEDSDGDIGYDFVCGAGGKPACTGVTFFDHGTYQQFSLHNTSLSEYYDNSPNVTANGLLIHINDDSGTPGTPVTFTSFAPGAGAVGATVTLTGTGFSATLANNVVRFNSGGLTGIQATVVSGSATQLVVTVPTGAVSGQLTVYNGYAVASSSESFTVNTASGTGGSDTISTPALVDGEFGVRFASNGTIQSVVEDGVVRFFSGNGDVVTGSGGSAGLLTDVYINIYDPIFNSVGFTSLPNAVGTYDCGDNYGALNGRNISLAYAAGQGYSTMGTKGVSGFSCTITITNVGTISGSNYTGSVEGTFKARLFKTGAPVNLATSIVASGTFRLGN